MILLVVKCTRHGPYIYAVRGIHFKTQKRRMVNVETGITKLTFGFGRTQGEIWSAIYQAAELSGWDKYTVTAENEFHIDSVPMIEESIEKYGLQAHMNTAKHAGIGVDGTVSIPLNWQPPQYFGKPLDTFGEELIICLPDIPKDHRIEVETALLVIRYKQTVAGDFEIVHLPSLPPLPRMAVKELLDRFKGILETEDVKQDETRHG